MNEPVTVERLIEFLKRLPPDAKVRVLKRASHGLNFNGESFSFEDAAFYCDGKFIDGIEHFPSLNLVDFGCS